MYLVASSAEAIDWQLLFLVLINLDLILGFGRVKMGEPMDNEKNVTDWVEENEIMAECVNILVKDGFITIEALTLLEKEDIGPKMPLGQYHLILRGRQKSQKGSSSQYTQ